MAGGWYRVMVIVIVIALVMSCGCTGTVPQTNVSTTPDQAKKTQITIPVKTLTQKSTVQVTKTITASPVKTPTPNQTAVPAPVKTTAKPTQKSTLQPVSTHCSASEPLVESVQVQKSVLLSGLNNCEMKKLFPAIANDKKYGIEANPSKLSGISANDWNAFVQRYTVGKTETSELAVIAGCENPPPPSPQNPNWNFIRLSAVVESPTEEPCTYDATFHLYGSGFEIGKVRMTETLTKDQKAIIQTYIPVKVDEMTMFDYFEPEFMGR